MTTTFQLPAATHIGYAHLQVADLQRSLAFYVDLLGFHEITRTGSTVVLSATGSAPAHLLITEHPGAPPKPRRSTGLYHIAILLPSRSALARVILRLGTHGWRLSGASDHLVSEALYLNDPDGNGLELYADRPRSGWRTEDGQLKMATEPLDLNDLLAQASQDESPWSGIDAGTITGHVHLHVADLERAVNFYYRVIGLDINIASLEMGAGFLSAGGYHHHLGLNTWAGRGAPPPPPEAAGLLSFSLRLPDQESWQQLLTHIQSLNVTVEQQKDGRAIVRDPDGMVVELFFSDDVY